MGANFFAYGKEGLANLNRKWAASDVLVVGFFGTCQMAEKKKKTPKKMSFLLLYNWQMLGYNILVPKNK